MSLALAIEGGTASELRDGTNPISGSVQGFQYFQYSVAQIQDLRSIRELVNSHHGWRARCLLLVNILFDRRGLLGDLFFCLLCMMTNFTYGDLVFLFVINDNKKCLTMDDELEIKSAIVDRSTADLFYIIFAIAQLRINLRGNARKYCSWLIFLIDLCLVLPIQQVVLILLMNQGITSSLMFAYNFVLVQYLGRSTRTSSLTRFSSSFTRIGSTSMIALLSLMFAFFVSFLELASAIGAIWYFSSIRSVTECWKKACINHIGSGCDLGSFYCNDRLANYTFVNDFCPTKTPNTTIYDFGIFQDAVQSGILEVTTDMAERARYGFIWAFQTLSGLGLDLLAKTSSWENIFAQLINFVGKVYPIYFVGILQIYMQLLYKTSIKMTLKSREIKHWPPFQKLSESLQLQIRKKQPYEWQGADGVNVENLLYNLSEDIKRDIRRELCLDLLKKVEEFGHWSETSLDELCDCVNPALFPKRTRMVRNGDIIDEMLFVIQGNLWVYSSRGTNTNDPSSSGSRDSEEKDFLKEGDFIGEELVGWVRDEDDPSSFDLPVSTRTVQALTNVEAFVLTAYDLKNVFIKRNQEFVLENQLLLSSNEQQTEHDQIIVEQP